MGSQAKLRRAASYEERRPQNDSYPGDSKLELERGEARDGRAAPCIRPACARRYPG